MFELKKHVKERLIKRTEGIISLLLIVLLVPFYSVAAILEEVGRYQSALRGLDSAISSSEMSVLAQYDQFLMDRFALLAIDQNKNIDQQFLSYLKKQDTQDTRSFSLSNAQTKATGVYPLADIEVLYQQINEFSTYTVPTKLILEGVNFDNIVSQLEGYSTTVSNVIKQLNSVGSSLQGGLDSYNAQKEASEQLDAVTKTTGEYAESYNRFKNAIDSLIEHKKTERPENEKEAAQWDEQLKNLLQEANTAKDDYQNQIDKERDGISSLAKKFDTAASKERSAYDTLVDGVTTAVSTKQASEKDVLNKNIQDNKGVIKEIDRQLAALGDDPQGENREEKRQLKALRDQVQERINEDTDSINKIANETTSMKEITDELKTGDNAKDVLEDYNSEACVDSLKGLNEEMEFLKGMDLETMNADSLENLAGKLHQVDLSKFSDTSSYKELWNNVRQSVGQESIQGVPMDFIDGIFALLSIDTLYDEDLNSKIDLNYYGKLPSQRIRSAQEYSLDSPFEKEDQKTAQDNLNKIGLPISEADSVELDGGINVGGQADDDGEATGNLFKKMIQMVNRLKKKMEGYKAVVDSVSNLAKGNSWDKVLLMGYLTYSVSNRTNYDSGVSLSGASFSGSGGLAPKYEAQNVRGEFLVKEENKYSFCGAEMEYLMTGKMSEYENQASVFGKLVALQSVMSIWAVANDPFVDGMKIGWSTAAAAVPYAGPALSFAMKILTPVLFAMANGTVDTLLLVNGNKVQLFKTAKGVHVNPTGFASALETLMNSKMFDSKDQATFKSVNEKMQARRDTYSTFKDAKVNENGLIIPSDTGTSSGADTSTSMANKNTDVSKKSEKKKPFDASNYGKSLNEFNYTEFMFIMLMVFYTGSTDQLLNRFVDIIQMEETNRALTTNNTQYSLKEQLTGTRKKFDVDKAYTAVRAEVNGKFVNVLPVPTLSKESVWTAHRIIYRGY